MMVVGDDHDADEGHVGGDGDGCRGGDGGGGDKGGNGILEGSPLFVCLSSPGGNQAPLYGLTHLHTTPLRSTPLLHSD